MANHPCREYQASEGNELERVTVRACVSTDAPGAREISDFHREMIARLSGQDSQASRDHQAGALMLEKQSVVSFRIPDPSQNRPYRMASLSSRTRINDIEVRPLSPQTFKPPQGFNRLPSRPQVNRPVVPSTGGNALEVSARGMAPDLHSANL